MKFTTFATSPLLLGPASLVTAVSPSVPLDQAIPGGISSIKPQGTKVDQKSDGRLCFTLGTFDSHFGEFAVSLVDEPVDGHLADGFCHNHTTKVVQDSQGNNCVFDNRTSNLHCSAESPKTKFDLNIRQPPAVDYSKTSVRPEMMPCTSLLRAVCLEKVKAQCAWCSQHTTDPECHKATFCPWRLSPKYGLSISPSPSPTTVYDGSRCTGGKPFLPAWHQYLRWCRDHPESDKCPYLPWTLNPKTIHSDNAFNDAIGFIRCNLLGQCQHSDISALTPSKTVQVLQNALEHVCTRYPPTCLFIPPVMEVVLSSTEVIADVSRLATAFVTGHGLEEYSRPALPKSSGTSHAAPARIGHSDSQGSLSVIDNTLRSATLEFICEELCSPLCDHIPSVMGIVDSILKGNADLQELTNAFQYYLARITPADVQTLTEGAEDIYDIFVATPSKLEDLIDAIKIDLGTLGIDGTWRLLRAGLSIYFRLSPSDEHKLFQTLGDVIARFDASSALS
ncbi:hypothetical protein CFIO01_12248 [Colletotrichum fioriniae PJ7]|uniref:Uncharacterized protein n=1 Tax=Colletotrichum fioriniae PJ7 TaxID=1445577 RepID=A0A010QYU7_9PEZI|nr:hypothetical protein CFIO01_12248 [Colletotrichum fioriniae PJ7]